MQPARPRLTPALLRAYRGTCYKVAGVQVTIGRRSQAMDALLSSHGAREAAFVTAYNPFSRLMPIGWNRRMQDRLAQAVRRRPVLAGMGQWRGWSEAHLVVICRSGHARLLARRFRQNGIVIVRLGQPARLLVTY